MDAKLEEQRLVHFLRREWRSRFDHFEIVDETGVNVLDVIKIDPDNFYDGIDADILEFEIHRIFAVDKDGVMITYIDFIDGFERFVANTKRLIEEEKGDYFVQMRKKRIYDRDITLAIIIASIGIAIGFIVTMLFWPSIIESLDQMIRY